MVKRHALQDNQVTLCRWVRDLALGILISMLSMATSAALETLPPGFINGAYEIIGRLPGATGDSYRAWGRILVEDDSLQVVRCVNGRYSEHDARLTSKTPDHIPALEMAFDVRGERFISTCIISSDFDNLPRLMCLTTPSDDPAIDVPGLESFFPIVWPVASDYFDCP